MNSQLALGLPPAPPSNTVVINVRCTLRAEEEQCVVVVGGLPVFHYCVADAMAEAYAMVMLVESGFAQQTEVARAFGVSERTVRRYQERYGQAGMAGLSRPEGWRRGRRRIAGKRLRLIERLKREGMSNRAIAQRLGVSEMAIRKLLGPSKEEGKEQLTWVPASSAPSPEPPPAPPSSTAPIDSAIDPAANEGLTPTVQESEEEEPIAMSLDRDARDRTFDRQMAYLGLLDDVAPIFRDGERVAGVGVEVARFFRTRR